MTATESDAALRALLDQVSDARGISCEAYKSSCLRRRVAVRMRACGVHTYAQYAATLARDTGEYDRLLDALTINVTSFYRNPETWNRLAADVLPDLWERRGSRVRCWSAGCASGEEPYTLAALLLDVARVTADDDLDACIDATDYDQGSLARAETGRYPATGFDEMPRRLVDRHFPPVPGAPDQREVADRVRRLVRFRRHDVTRDPPPLPPYDLILLRNVVIYFDRPMQEHLFNQMAGALSPGGRFVLGKVETLHGEARHRLELEDIRERIYRLP